MSTDTALVTLDSFPALAEQGGALSVLEAMQSNLGANETFSEWDLIRVEMPQGRGKQFQIETLSGVHGVEEITGVIIHHQTTRAYFESDDIQQGVPPDCVSHDGIIGFGTDDVPRGVQAQPNGGYSCADCAMSKFGTARKGKGQACKMRRPLFILTEEYGKLPLFLNTPPASIAGLHKYGTQLGIEELQHHQVLTTLGLDLISDAANPYSRITFKYAGRIDPEWQARVDPIRAALRNALEGTPSTTVAVTVEDEAVENVPF